MIVVLIFKIVLEKIKVWMHDQSWIECCQQHFKNKKLPPAKLFVHN